jgi:hypothetical protein
MDAQKSENNGVFLTLTGHVTFISQPTRPFVQSFFLASQSTVTQKASTVSYYVRNSVFRLLDVPNTNNNTVIQKSEAAAPSVTVTDVPVNEVTTEEIIIETTTDITEYNEEATYVEIVNHEETPGVEVATPDEIIDIEDEVEVNETSPIVIDTTTESQKVSAAKTFADIVKRYSKDTPDSSPLPAVVTTSKSSRGTGHRKEKERTRGGNTNGQESSPVPATPKVYFY